MIKKQAMKRKSKFWQLAVKMWGELMGKKPAKKNKFSTVYKWSKLP
jgi:hypothetical protein